MLKKNSMYEVEINDYTHDGLGIGKIDNRVIFVPGSLKGEKVRVKIIKINKKFIVGKLLNIITISQNREKPLCDIYDKCGGCHIQHYNYMEQLDFKYNYVKKCIEKIAKISDFRNDNIIYMENTLCYRNKAQYPVKNIDGNISAGFYAKKSHCIVLNSGCIIQNEEIENVKNCIILILRKFNITTYNEETGTGLLRHIVVRYGLKTDERLLILVLNKENIILIKKVIEEINKSIKLTGIVINVNEEKTNVIMGKKNICLYGRNYIYDYIGQYKYKISPNSFYQVNPVQTEKLYNRVLEYLNPSKDESVFDLYCGIGTIGIFISKYVKRVIGVEIVSDAVLDANENAKINNVKNIEFYKGNVKKVVDKLYKEGKKADAVILDPPRKGCDESLLETIILMNPKKIVYVSCNPSTLARDLKFLNLNGFKLSTVGAVDMFPHTYHSEAVALIERGV